MISYVTKNIFHLSIFFFKMQYLDGGFVIFIHPNSFIASLEIQLNKLLPELSFRSIYKGITVSCKSVSM